MDIKVGTALVVASGWMVSLCLHEFGHAVVAYIGGDKSVKDKGYLTLNPLKYTDPGLTLVIPLIILMIGGIALPGAAVYIDRRRLRNRLWQSLVSLAGPVGNMIVLGILAVPFLLGMHLNSNSWIWPSLALLALFQAIAIVLNLLPIPPMDGYGVIEPWLPRGMREAANKFGTYGIWLLFAVLWFVKPLNAALWLSGYLGIALLGIPPALAEEGYDTFHQGSYLVMILLIVILVLSKSFKKK